MRATYPGRVTSFQLKSASNMIREQYLLLRILVLLRVKKAMIPAKEPLRETTNPYTKGIDTGRVR